MTTTQEILQAQKAQLREQMAGVRAKIAVLKESSAPLQAQLDAKIAEHNALGAEVADLARQVDAIEQPMLAELKRELADLARAEIAIKA